MRGQVSGSPAVQIHHDFGSKKIDFFRGLILVVSLVLFLKLTELRFSDLSLMDLQRPPALTLQQRRLTSKLFKMYFLVSCTGKEVLNEGG